MKGTVVLFFRTSPWLLFAAAFNSFKFEDYFEAISRLEVRCLRILQVLYVDLTRART